MHDTRNQTEMSIGHISEYKKLRRVIKQYFGAKADFSMKPDEEGITISEVFETLRKHKVVLAGGACLSIFTGARVNDLDFYVKDVSQLEFVKEFIISCGYDEVFRSINAVTYRRKTKAGKKYSLQLITKFTGEPADIFDWFDFTITNAAYDFEFFQFAFGNRFWPDVAARRLVYGGKSHYPICALHRTKKYQERGYTVSGATLMHIALSILQLEITNYGQLKEQLMGIDTTYLQGLLGEDRFDDALPVNYGEFVSEIFERLAPDLDV